MAAADKVLPVDLLDVVADLEGISGERKVLVNSFCLGVKRKKCLLLTLMWGIWLAVLPSLILLMNAYPAPLSVMVRPRASPVLCTSTSFG